MKRLFVFMGIVFVLLLSACGPSPEQVATLTAAAWTPTPRPTATPLPTFTPTPIPYDLTVSVVDEAGAPVEGASIVFPESGSNEPVQVDATGKFSWNNLPGETATLKILAQGYFETEQTATLERGPSEISVALQPDPFGLLPAEACAAGEKLLYAEDFQDKRALGWNEIDLKTPGWDLIPSLEEAGNTILSAQYSDMLGDGPLNSRLEGMEFDNAAWRVNFFISAPFTTEQNWFSFNWKHALQPFDLNGQEVFDSRYQIPLRPEYYALRRLQQPVTNIGIGQTKGPKVGEWHLVEISSYQGVIEVWADGTRLMSYEDPQPVPAGTIGLELWLSGSDTVVYFDNISVCELSAAFTSIAPAAP
jgi:hypothetical protein